MLNTIDVVVTLTSPLYEAYPDNYDKSNMVSYTLKKPIVAGNKVTLVPFYAANGFRGGLRRKMASRIMDHLAATYGPISGDLYNGIRCGASNASPDSTKSIEEVLRARKHVYMGLFGGGARLHESMYIVSDMNPILDATLVAGMVPAFCEDWKVMKRDGENLRPAEPWEITGRRHFVRKDDLFNVAAPDEIRRVVKDCIITVSEHQEQVRINVAERKENNATKTDVANLQTFESIIEGTPMHFCITLNKDVTDAQIGAMLLSLHDLLAENAFGGWVRAGFGKVRVEYFRVALPSRDIGIVLDYKDAQKHDAFAIPDALTGFVEAAQAEIAAITTDEMVEYFTSRKSKE